MMMITGLSSSLVPITESRNPKVAFLVHPNILLFMMLMLTSMGIVCLPLIAPFLTSSNNSMLGSSLIPRDQGLLHISSCNVSTRAKLPAHKGPLIVQASTDHGRQGSAGMFIGGFVLGGILAGTLGCVYAPQISKALAGADKKDLMRKLPKFIYDEEKALEKTRKVLAEKIEQLNSAIDEVSAQLHREDAPNGVAVASDEIKAYT